MSTINESIMTLSGMEYYEGKNKDRLKNELAKKVDKVNGKGLSTNDFTTAEKEKLAGISTGANKVTIDSVLSSTSTNPVQNKVVNDALSGKVPTTRKINSKDLSSDITLSASDVGLGNVGNFKAVSTVASQGLTDTEKSNARANIGAQPSGSYASASHTHDDRYYTESEINTKLNGKANSSHTHGNGDITSLDAGKITSGTISIDRLPQGALERLIIVADDTARFNLTSATVQKGDTVKVTATSKMYYVVDESKLSTEEGYEVYTAGSATSVPWSGVTGKPSTYTPSSHTHDDRYYTESEIDSKLKSKANSSHTHTKSQITDFPTSMPANGGNASTVNGHTVESDVPANAKFTDTTYSSKAATSGGTDVSLVTTGEKAIWNAKTSNAGTITGIKMNGASKGTSGVVDLGTVLTGGKQSTTSTADGGSNVYTFSDGSTITVKNGSKGSSGTNGTNGSNGTSAAWFTGTAVTGTSTTATSFSVSGSKAGDMYLNTSTYNVYRASASNSWVYVCNIKGASGTNGTNGTTPTIKAASGSNIGSVGTPSVSASTSGTTTTFTFNHLKGATGATGTRGTALSLGTAITGTSTTATIFSSSGLTSSLVNDVYLNTSTFNMYKCTVAGNAATAKWVYVGCIKGANGTNATTTAVATTSANGLMSKDMVTKLNGIATGANNYTHPTSSGNKHIPSGGSSGQILRWSADGTAVWGADNNTWTAFKGATSSAAGTAGYVPAPAKGDQAKFFRADGTWQTVSAGGNKTAYQTSEPTGQSNNDEWLKEY